MHVYNLNIQNNKNVTMKTPPRRRRPCIAYRQRVPYCVICSVCRTQCASCSVCRAHRVSCTVCTVHCKSRAQCVPYTVCAVHCICAVHCMCRALCAVHSVCRALICASLRYGYVHLMTNEKSDRP